MNPTSQTELKVRGYHLDLYQHVNNARYLEFLEEGRWHYMEEQADLLPLLSQGLTFAVVNININYRKPSFLGETLVIETTMKEVLERKAIMHQRVLEKDSGVVKADADVMFVLIDAMTGKAVTITDEMKKIFLKQ